MSTSKILMLSFAGAVIIWAACVKAFLHPVIVQGESMMPTYNNREILFTDPVSGEYDLDRDDVIVFTRGHGKDEKSYIKRIAALPGDTIYISEGCLIRNDNIVESEFQLMEDSGWITEPVTVPDGYVFVLGDNRNASTDSRTFGFVAIDSIYGLVM